MGSKPEGLSASRGSSILRQNKWTTVVQTWLKIMEEREPGFCKANGYEIEVQESSLIMDFGLAFEDAICSLSEEMVNDNKSRLNRIVDREKFHRHEILDFVTCHIDGRYETFKALHEGKTTNIFTWKDGYGEPGSNRVPGDYTIQVQHQMICTKAKECILSVLVFPKRQDEFEAVPENPEQWAELLYEMGYFHQYIIPADPFLQELMLQKYEKFWRDCVIGRQPPRPQNYDDIKRLVIEPKGTIVANNVIERWSAEYKDIGQEISKADARKKELKTKILEFMYRQADVPIDNESQEKWVLRSRKGRKLHSFNGKLFR